jgi:hypothetical protein
MLLPFGDSNRGEQIVRSYKTISVEGRFKVDNLMSPTPKTTPVPMVRAVIDSDFVCNLTAARTLDDLAELDDSAFELSDDRSRRETRQTRI